MASPFIFRHFFLKTVDVVPKYWTGRHPKGPVSAPPSSPCISHFIKSRMQNTGQPRPTARYITLRKLETLHHPGLSHNGAEEQRKGKVFLPEKNARIIHLPKHPAQIGRFAWNRVRECSQGTQPHQETSDSSVIISPETDKGGCGVSSHHHLAAAPSCADRSCYGDPAPFPLTGAPCVSVTGSWHPNLPLASGTPFPVGKLTFQMTIHISIWFSSEPADFLHHRSKSSPAMYRRDSTQIHMARTEKVFQGHFLI